MDSFLAQACAAAHQRVAVCSGALPLAALRERALAIPAPPDFAAALSEPGVAVIAEVKRASPSRGALAAIPDPAALAGDYVAGGAAAVSVLTEPAHFGGSLGDLRAVSAATGVPVVRKDFIVDGYQLWEAREAGAAAALLIVAALQPRQLSSLLDVAGEAGLQVLVETHTGAEIRLAVAAWERRSRPPRRPLVVGINARDLATLQVDSGRFAALRGVVPDGALAVAESGVRDAADVRRLAGAGADAVLVGESVATAADPALAVSQLVAAGRAAVARAGADR